MTFPVAPSAGIWSGAVYKDRSIRDGLGMRGEGIRNNSVLVVKSHLSSVPAKEMVKNFNQTVYLVRNPFHSILAERKRIVATTHAHTSNPLWSQIVLGKSPSGPKWQQTCKIHWNNWTALAAQKVVRTDQYLQSLIDLGMPVHTIRFEDLQSDLWVTMAGALQFIGA